MGGQIWIGGYSRRIKPEELPAEEDIKKLERRVKSEEKKLERQSGRLPGKVEES